MSKFVTKGVNKLHEEKKSLYYDEVIKLYSEHGYGYTRISQTLPVGRTTVLGWIHKHAASHPEFAKLMEDRKIGGATPLGSDETDKIAEREAALVAEVKRLKGLLKNANIKVEAYEMMLKVAERDYGFDVRKKLGDKQ